MSVQGDVFRFDPRIDDVMVFGRSFGNAIDNLKQVFCTLHAAGLKLKHAKCKLFRRSLTFLSFLSSESFSCDTRNIEAIRDWPVPQSLTEAKCSRVSQLLPSVYKDFAAKVSIQTCLTTERTPFIWIDSYQDTFEILERLFDFGADS